jgi:hypothetical protein
VNAFTLASQVVRLEKGQGHDSHINKMYSNMMLASLEREGNFKITAQIRCFLKVRLDVFFPDFLKGKKNKEKQEL